MEPFGQRSPFENVQIPQVLGLCMIEVQVPALQNVVKFHGGIGRMFITRFSI